VIVYEDVISGDQVLSDSYAQKPLTFNGEVVPGVVTVQARLKQKGPIEVNTGANASTEGGGEDEGVDDSVVKVNDIKDADIGFGYEGPQSYSEAEFGTLYKMWCKAVKEKIESAGCASFAARARAREQRTDPAATTGASPRTSWSRPRPSCRS